MPQLRTTQVKVGVHDAIPQYGDPGLGLEPDLKCMSGRCYDVPQINTS
jgi:hypothetical protein